jgi:hypothetical protein
LVLIITQMKHVFVVLGYSEMSDTDSSFGTQ